MFTGPTKMALLNPCCCITLRTGTKIVAAFDIIVALIVLIIFISDLALNIDGQYGKQEGINTYLFLSKENTVSDDSDNDTSCEEDADYISVAGNVSTPYVTTGVWTIMTVFLATNVGISALLYTGARNYSIRRCKWWFYIQTVITSVSLVILILILCFQVSFVLVVFDLIIHLIYRMYTLWVVYLFIGELTYLDTLCCLNKKGGAGNMAMSPAPIYTNGSSMGSTSPTSYDYYAHTNIYANTPYQQRQYPEDLGTSHAHSGNITASIGGKTSPIHHYNSSDDGLPVNNGKNGTANFGNQSGGGIDNPTYLP